MERRLACARKQAICLLLGAVELRGIAVIPQSNRAIFGYCGGFPRRRASRLPAEGLPITVAPVSSPRISFMAYLALGLPMTACVGMRSHAQGNTPKRPASACDGNTVVLDKSTEMIGDFEAGATDDWNEFHQESAVKVTLVVEPGGANGSGHAAHFSGGPVLSGAQMTRTMLCLDVSKYDGVELWLKASAGSQVELTLPIPETLEARFGGDCHQTCISPFVRFPVSANWARYAVPFEAFRSPRGLAIHGTVMSMDVRARGKFDVWVDQVRFYAGQPAADATVIP